jgi:hypothetical protein
VSHVSGQKVCTNSAEDSTGMVSPTFLMNSSLMAEVDKPARQCPRTCSGNGAHCHAGKVD